MNTISIQTLGRMIAEKRAALGYGLRKVAEDIGVSHGTLSRVERGYLPDLDTFGKICHWLEVDPGEVLGTKAATSKTIAPAISVHFRKDQAIQPKTADALAHLILAAQQALLASYGGQE